MARPKKTKAEYFPHFSKGGKTIFILESLYGNDGYAFWFKLLELLCDTDNQVYDYRNPTNKQFLLAKTHLTEDIAVKIIQTLIELGQIDGELWTKGQIWVQNLVNNLEGLYERRKSDIPTKEGLLHTETSDNESLCEQKPPTNDVSAHINPHSIVEKSREEKRIVYPYQDIVRLWNETCRSLPRVQKLNDDRRSKIKSRLGEFGKDPEAWMPTAAALFEAVEASDFLSGRNGTWQASFDWLFSNPTNWVKVMEGNYSNNKQGGAATPQHHPTASGQRLGVGEYIEPSTGRRTYGTGRATIPPTAPPRPTDKHAWSSEQQNWILL